MGASNYRMFILASVENNVTGYVHENFRRNALFKLDNINIHTKSINYYHIKISNSKIVSNNVRDKT